MRTTDFLEAMRRNFRASCPTSWWEKSQRICVCVLKPPHLLRTCRLSMVLFITTTQQWRCAYVYLCAHSKDSCRVFPTNRACTLRILINVLHNTPLRVYQTCAAFSAGKKLFPYPFSNTNLYLNIFPRKKYFSPSVLILLPIWGDGFLLNLLW